MSFLSHSIVYLSSWLAGWRVGSHEKELFQYCAACVHAGVCVWCVQCTLIYD